MIKHVTITAVNLNTTLVKDVVMTHISHAADYVYGALLDVGSLVMSHVK